MMNLSRTAWQLIGGISMVLLTAGCESGGGAGGGGLFSGVSSLFGFGGSDSGGSPDTFSAAPPPFIFPSMPPVIPVGPSGAGGPDAISTLYNPEPSSLALFGIGSGVVGLVSLRRKRRQRRR